MFINRIIKLRSGFKWFTSSLATAGVIVPLTNDVLSCSMYNRQHRKNLN